MKTIPKRSPRAHRTQLEGHLLLAQIRRIVLTRDFTVKEVAMEAGVSASYATHLLHGMGYRCMLVGADERSDILGRRAYAAGSGEKSA